LEGNGQDAALARELLRRFEEVLALHAAGRDRLERELEAS
jgi:hypothetical protein